MRRLLCCLLLLGSGIVADAARAQSEETPPPDTQAPPNLQDDGDKASLLEAIAQTRRYLNGLNRKSLSFAGRMVSLDLLRRGLADFEELVQRAWGQPTFDTELAARFTWVPMPGKDAQGSVHFTGYYRPMLEAREQADETFRFPLYAPPADMLPLDLGAFRPSLAGQVAMARIKAGRILPYYTRKEIDDGQALAGRGLEIAWVADANARASLMIQGSGILRFPDGRTTNVAYAGQNGHVFLGGDQRANPSYVFFRLTSDGPTGCDGVPLTGGRAIATDKRLFPTGGLLWISYPRARFDARGRVTGLETGGRFVLDQDTGGAITGPGRIDVFWGAGEEATRRAFALNGQGRAWFLLPREAPLGEPSVPAPLETGDGGVVPPAAQP
ncbi:MAG: MltA domain-containing protein [Candidatus Sericytochromatia bacterium]|nr:MltA domain-containing protein [Candidatus Sericytochromatia bacterium]